MKLLIIEDDKYMAKSIEDALGQDYVFDIAFSGEEGIYEAEINDYDLILLDYILPDMNGVQVLTKLRKEGVTIPVLMLTGKDDLNKRVTSLESGGDDYLVKPFHLEELRARVRALLRRSHRQSSNIITIDNLKVDFAAKIVYRGNQKIQLRRKEFDLLEYFVRNAGKVLTRTMILDHVWDSSYESFANTVDVHINYLRSHIDKPFPKKLIKTIHGIGYKLDA